MRKSKLEPNPNYKHNSKKSQRCEKKSPTSPLLTTTCRSVKPHLLQAQETSKKTVTTTQPGTLQNDSPRVDYTRDIIPPSHSLSQAPPLIHRISVAASDWQPRGAQVRTPINVNQPVSIGVQIAASTTPTSASLLRTPQLPNLQHPMRHSAFDSSTIQRSTSGGTKPPPHSLSQASPMILGTSVTASDWQSGSTKVCTPKMIISTAHIAKRILSVTTRTYTSPSKRSSLHKDPNHIVQQNTTELLPSSTLPPPQIELRATISPMQRSTHHGDQSRFTAQILSRFQQNSTLQGDNTTPPSHSLSQASPLILGTSVTASDWQSGSTKGHLRHCARDQLFTTRATLRNKIPQKICSAQHHQYHRSSRAR
ncbi:uncharacterized protein LOC129745148 [Uranotaenia lowii]|uniref:uncharacterized protein LOC129745148 n=1 Tax=Uranotaenia lowii TaxID=190385 RepID=UPI0024788657|nr:uncharacterized protein LOC129745148 [Uranotaenia lowii]